MSETRVTDDNFLRVESQVEHRDSKRRVAAAVALAVALGGTVSADDGIDAAMRIRPIAESKARSAIASGSSCTVKGIKPHEGQQVDLPQDRYSRIALQVRVETKQTAASRAARTEYANSPRVTWDGTSGGGEVAQPGSARRMPVLSPALTYLKPEGTSSFVINPRDDGMYRPGAELHIFTHEKASSEYDDERGARSEMAISETHCGTLVQTGEPSKVGGWVVDPHAEIIGQKVIEGTQALECETQGIVRACSVGPFVPNKLPNPQPTR